MQSGRLLAALLLAALSSRAQVIEFYSNGLKYLTLTRAGVTVMYTEMPMQVHRYAVLQVAVINGAPVPHTVQPTGITYQLPDGRLIPALGEQQVIAELQRHGGRNDVIKLVTAYERAISGATEIRSNNGYEQRRQFALSMGGPTGLKAAAAASALALVKTRLRPKDSTDGAVFFPNEGKPLGPGVLRVRIDDQLFEFRPDHAGS
jgi:hypothetical protein